MILQIKFSLLGIYMYVLLWPKTIQASSIFNKLNIMSYNSTCIELLRSLLFTLYIYSLGASRLAELARRQ